MRHAEVRRLAVGVREAGRVLEANRAELAAIVNDLVPGLTDQRGIGPVTAAQAIVSFSHAGRCRNDAAIAKLAGTSPIEASSGQTTRHRLNRGGDRALNKAIHIIANTRIRSDPATQAYVARRTAEGKNTREIRRCLKQTTPAAWILRCQRWDCIRTFHPPLHQRGQPRRYCSPACRLAEHRRLRM